MESPVPFNIFLLGIGPSVNASIILTLWSVLPVLPGYGELQQLRQRGTEGMELFRQYIQVLAVFFAIPMGASKALELLPLKAVTGELAKAGTGFGASCMRFLSITDTAATLVAGAVLLRWLTDHVEHWGLGDGITLVICTSITARYLAGLPKLLSGISSSPAPIWQIAAMFLGLAAIIFAGMYLSQLERRHPIVHYRPRPSAKQDQLSQTRDQYLQQLLDNASRKKSGGSLQPETQHMSQVQQHTEQHQGSHVSSPLAEKPASTDYLPLRLLPNGMSPLLMASFYLSIIPRMTSTLLGWMGLGKLATAVNAIYNPSIQPFMVAASVMLMTNVQLQSNTKETAEWLLMSDLGLKGVVPGAATAKFLDRQQALMRAIGSVALAGMTLAAHALDNMSASILGMPLGCMSLLLMASFMSSAQRQVSTLLKLPRTQVALERELLLTQQYC
ncbi:hypothetical protein WJX73_009904 [Symbiochloris irregularis]|uniref:Preprotein translocase subunit SecY n=1 Tax=Symbiochloris irregularis TaxID=706552 RepID=A0AAW1NXD2_9CHLO